MLLGQSPNGTERFQTRFFSGQDPKQFKGFTLIELLIVIAIILILIAIALPNFLEAQIRARVTKAKGEIRSLGIAQEAYYLDWNYYPSESENNPYARPRTEQGLYWLTSPIAYMTSIPSDPFGEQGTGGELTVYETGGCEVGGPPVQGHCGACLVTWVIYTLGPDGATDVNSNAPHYESRPDGLMQFSPTNGTKSRGDIFLYGGDSFWIGMAVQNASAPGRGVINSTGVSSFTRPLVVNGVPHLHKLPPAL